MDTVDFPRFMLAFVFVVGLIGLLAMFLKRYGSTAKTFLNAKEGTNRIEVLEVKYIDSKRRLVLVRRDEVEHLLLLADGRETVIESVIKGNRDAK
jgi:flagellar protein FliO/FliZ